MDACQRCNMANSCSKKPAAEEHVAKKPNYNYDPCSKVGPHAWGNVAKDCLGCNQSPINIDSCMACRVKPNEDLKLTRWDDMPDKIVLHNVGTTVKIYFTYKSGGAPTISNGPLNDIYELSHVHFHWSCDSKEGSEHYLNGKSSSAEAHAVFTNKKYGFNDAMANRDGLAVVGRLFRFCSKKHRYLPFTSKLKRVTKFNETYTIKEPHQFTLSCLMGPIGFEYFVYQGSLTTPPCSEAVTWIVAMNTKNISILDLEELRKLRDSEGGWMSPNFRKIQPSNDRAVYHYTS